MENFTGKTSVQRKRLNVKVQSLTHIRVHYLQYTIQYTVFICFIFFGELMIGGWGITGLDLEMSLAAKLDPSSQKSCAWMTEEEELNKKINVQQRENMLLQA